MMMGEWDEFYYILYDVFAEAEEASERVLGVEASYDIINTVVGDVERAMPGNPTVTGVGAAVARWARE